MKNTLGALLEHNKCENCDKPIKYVHIQEFGAIGFCKEHAAQHGFKVHDDDLTWKDLANEEIE